MGENKSVKEIFKEEYFKYIHRDGAEDLFRWLESTDFFTAPASTRFHGNYEGGLCEHSLNVMRLFAREVEAHKDILGIKSWKEKAESIAICGLLHDSCKIFCYKTEMRNKKDENGTWVRVPYYTFVEDNPMGGHGCKSVFLVMNHMKLTAEEQTAINTHMGAYDRSPGDYSLNNAYVKYPFAYFLHVADNLAAMYFEETK